MTSADKATAPAANRSAPRPTAGRREQADDRARISAIVTFRVMERRRENPATNFLKDDAADDRFHRAAAPDIEGNGLGLAIAESIARRHVWRLGLKTAPIARACASPCPEGPPREP